MRLEHQSCEAAMLGLDMLSKRFPGQTHWAVSELSMQLADGEITALIGPSGCGKTTTLRLIAGFETPTAGDIRVRGRSVLAIPPQRRRIGVVFQDYALFSHLSVEQNVAFGLTERDPAIRRRIAMTWLERVDLTAFADRHPGALSGGQQQRVALIRSLATRPDLLLLDEPFSNLDAAHRESIRRDVQALLKQSSTTALIVTHDRGEALSFSDRIGVMRDGRLLQVGTPKDVYAEPRSAFVADFLGRTNLLPAAAEGRSASCLLGTVALARPAAGECLLSLRPEQIDLAPATTADQPSGVLVEREFGGHAHLYWIEVTASGRWTGQRLRVLASADQWLDVGTRVTLRARTPGWAIPVDDRATVTDAG